MVSLLSDKWIDLFPTIVTKADTIQVLENGSFENRNGALHLMMEKMHILSPLVSPREFVFLRYCYQVEAGVWVITDVSHDPRGENTRPPSRSWRHPSGCLIQDLHNGCSMVTWVEHVEVREIVETHTLFRDLVTATSGYGAERRIMELQRVCERFSRLHVENMPNYHYGGVINSAEGKRSVMNLSHRMVKIFSGSLSMPGIEYPHLTVENKLGVRVSIRKIAEPGQPNGMVVIAIASIWLPLHYQKLFDFLTDAKARAEWDILAGANGVREIAQISNGIHPSNGISIIQPYMPNESNALILQESFSNPNGSYIVYAPVDVSAMHVVLSGERTSMIPILPSGFVVSADGRSNEFQEAFDASNSGGSLFTVAFQTLACNPTDLGQEGTMESVTCVHTLLASTVEKIKAALQCDNWGE